MLVFNVIHNIHIPIGIGERTGMTKDLYYKHKNVTLEYIITYLRLCEPFTKKQKSLKKVIVFKEILHIEMNSLYQVDLIDMQSTPDRHMKFFIVYHDHLTKFFLPQTFRSKKTDHVA